MSSPIPIISTVLSLGAALFYWFLHFRRAKQGMTNSTNLVMTAAASLHTMLVLSNLAFHRPPNLFTRLGIPINAPVHLIRALLTREAGFNLTGEQAALVVPPEIPKDVEMLLTRLGIDGSRDKYVRFGQVAVQTCTYCSSAIDYTTLVLSGVLLEYLRTAALLLFLTTTMNGRQRWRTNILGALTCAFLAEMYTFTYASALPVEKDAQSAFMWHDNLFFARNVLFVVLPIFVQYLPAIYPPPPASAVLVPALARLERTLPRTHLLKYVRQAVLRHPYTRRRTVEYWTENAAEGAMARNDPNVQTIAAKLGYGFASPGDKVGPESVLRGNARTAVRSLKPLFMPPPN